ncbi:MAG: sensor histidine kinase [Tissierellia bacterium]|nr:sensor histidine kinase [Tissierellia bacterium]
MIKNIWGKSLRHKVWTYFIMFASTIILVLWLLQIVFFNNYYEIMKTNEIKKIGNSLVNQYGEEGFEDVLYTTSRNEGIIIQILNESGSLIYPLNSILDVLRQPRLNDAIFYEFLMNLNEAEENYVIYRKEDTRLSSPTLVYGAILENNRGSNYYLYINSMLEPVDSTVNVLKNQLIIVTLISLGLSLALSYYLATKLTKPIERITETAESLAQGDYKVEFQKGDYIEIDNLVDTLNYTTKELSKTEELRRDLIANVSHDLKTPLTLIKSYAEMIRDISGNNESKRNYHVTTIIDEADKLSHLVNDMLNLSKVQTGLDKMDFKGFDITKTTENALKRFKYFVDNEGFRFYIKSKGNTIVLGEETKIEQVIYNLISNAINYSTTIKEIRINIIDEGEMVKLEVIDKGIGIDEAELDSIWDRYYKVGKSHKRARVGSGIGLSIVKSILLAHKAQFGVESKLGQGSRFYFKLNKAGSLVL